MGTRTERNRDRSILLLKDRNETGAGPTFKFLPFLKQAYAATSVANLCTAVLIAVYATIHCFVP